jgi:GNAT superfamily N-acetyltransferase
MIISEELDPCPETIAAIEKGLDSFNLSKVGYDDQQTVWLVARDETGTVQGGLKGYTFFTWSFVSWLWVDENHRGKGLGSDLLDRMEAIARNRNCRGIYLDTFTFQAPSFYQKLGYQEFGRLDDIPPGYSRIWMKKML